MDEHSPLYMYDEEHVLHHLLDSMGINFEDVNFTGTPKRWLKYLKHYLQPFDPKDTLGVTFPVKYADKFNASMVVQTGIPFRAICAHHLVPVLGTAHVGYIPKDRVVGLSKLSRLVYGISHASPSLQEDVCASVVDALMDHLAPLGAMCVIDAEHGCMAARGVEEATGCTSTATANVRGVFAERREVRQEFYDLIKVRHG